MSEQIKQFLKDCNLDKSTFFYHTLIENSANLTSIELALFSQLSNIKNDLRIIGEKVQDDANWRGAVTTALVGPGSEEISRGRALEIIAELKNGKVVE
jgi:hypothetical protein